MVLRSGAGYLLARPAARRLVPGFTAVGVLFGVWYALAALA